LSAPPDSLAAVGGLLLRGRKGTGEEESRGERKKGDRKRRGKRVERKGGETTPLSKIPPEVTPRPDSVSRPTLTNPRRGVLTLIQIDSNGLI